MFTLFNIESQALLSSRIAYEDGRRASRAARLLSQKTKARWQPRKIEQIDNSAWHARERARFESGEYIALADVFDSPVAVYEKKTNIELFAHHSKKNPALIAYTKDASKGAQDKQSLISIDGFLDLIGADLSPALKVILKSNHNERAATIAPQAFHIAKTPDEIVRVYTNWQEGIRALDVSCMRGSEGEWPRVDNKPFHPVRIYGDSDLAIAYLKNENNETTARCLIWPEKKIYSRIYAEGDSLHQALQAAGYNKSSYYNSSYKSLRGAKLRLIHNDNGNIVAPYLDEIGTVENDGENLIIGGDIDCQRTDGQALERGEYTCDACGADCDEDDTYSVNTDSRGYSTETWCRCCYENETFFCEGTEETYSTSVDRVCVGDSYYTQRYAETHFNYCDRYEEYTDEETSAVIINESGETESWSDSAIENYAYSYNDEWFSDDINTVEVITARSLPLALRYKALVWYHDAKENIPEYLIENGDVEAVEVNGQYYLKDYKDHYPLDRPRLDIESDDSDIESIAA